LWWVGVGFVGGGLGFLGVFWLVWLWFVVGVVLYGFRFGVLGFCCVLCGLGELCVVFGGGLYWWLLVGVGLFLFVFCFLLIG
jgi:hypothetical protein